MMSAREIGIWYFRYGWIIALVVGMALGWLAGQLKSSCLLFLTVISMAILGFVMMFFKYSL